MSTKRPRPWIALTLGDPAGVGPELCLRALDDPSVREAANLVVIGPAALRPAEVEELDARASLPDGGRGEGLVRWLSIQADEVWEPGRVQRSAGLAALAALRAGHELALSGHVDALVTAPVSKAALHLAGEAVEGQTELLGRWCGVERFQMLACALDFAVLLLTRHLPLRSAIGEISEDRVVDHLVLLDESLRRLRGSAPRLALAGLNPHAGEDGLLGREEQEILVPAVRVSKARGIDVTGPLSPDSVFLRAARGEFDGVLALYHDQAFIPLKLLGEGSGVTVIPGLPYLRVSPIHGTAFDLVGTGRASAQNLIAAIEKAAAWAPLWRTAPAVGATGR